MSGRSIQDYYASLRVPTHGKYVRLLHVKAPIKHEGFDEPLCCDLSVVDLNSQPSYAALSYTWGSLSSSVGTVLCGNVDLPISSNGLSALRHSRAKLGDFTVWIDAVCINQYDDEEKARQIPLMGDIYQRATTTYFWLGEKTPARYKAIQYLRRAGFVQFYFNTPASMWHGGVSTRTWMALLNCYWYMWTFESSTLPYPTKASSWPRCWLPSRFAGASLNDIHDLLDCTWITRIWTYQEAVLAHRPIIVCGDLHIEWDRFALSMIFLSYISQSKYLAHWIEVVISRAIFQKRIRDSDIPVEQLRSYCRFCESFVNLRHRFTRMMDWIQNIPLIVALIQFVTSALWLIITSTTNFMAERLGRSQVIALFLSFPVFLAVRIVTSLILRLAPGGRYPSPLFRRLPWDAETLLDHDIHDRLLETLATRHATNAKDMSFGLHSLLKYRSEEDSAMFAVRYHEPVPVIYQRLTIHMMRQTNSLKPLLFAAAQKCVGAPSWVPDYSHALMDSLRSGGYVYEATPRSKPYFRQDDIDNSILIVKGVSTEAITEAVQFRRTDILYDSTDTLVHLNNLKLLLRWYRLLSRRDSTWYSPMDSGYLEEKLISADNSITAGDVQAYFLVLRSACSESLQTRRNFEGMPEMLNKATLKAWNRIQERLHLRRNLLHVHCHVMNTLADMKMKVITTCNGNVGCCFGDTEKGDHIYLVSGVEYPIVMRGRGSEKRLITVAHIIDHRLKLRQKRLRRQYHNGSIWCQIIRRLQKEDDPKWREKPRLYESDPENRLETILPDIRIC